MAERKSDLAFAAFFGSGKSGGGSGGAVSSVNGKTGNVTLTAADVGALPDDTPIPAAVTEQTVSGWGFTKNTGTYSKPSGGIPKSDLASAVQTSLGKADTALQAAPVTSVNGKTGAVVLSASDVGAAAAGAVYTKEEIEQKLVGAMTYMGTKAAVSDLPVTGNTIGDVWHITADGAEWAWDGSEWQNLGTVVDISGKADKSALDAHTGNTTIHVTAADKTAWNGKQDAISDLATIRSGAAAGATAVQPGSLATVATSGSYNDLSNKPTIPTVPTDEISANTAARHTHSNKSLLDTYTQTEANLADAVSKKHTHSNKTVLDGITAAKLLPTVTTSDNDKFLRVVSGAWAAATVPSAETASF